MIAVAGIGYFISTIEPTDYSSPEYITRQQKCEDLHLAKASAISFLRTKLNLASSPDFETWSLEKSVRKASKDGEDCSYWIIDHFTFTNEYGAEVRRFAEIKVQPVRGSDAWRLIEFDIR